MEITPKEAPNKLAITSNTSALLVTVKNFCISSIAIPNRTDKTNETSRSLKLVNLPIRFLK